MAILCPRCLFMDKSEGRDDNGKIKCDDGRGWIYPKDSCSDFQEDPNAKSGC
ncbi:MAG: hypothetical protein IJJ59_06465 [Pseudobutyrivibrio sp.]|uniref:hypothetical protein n=1 Tax=Pseudobutyrivibrio sp. TaxID=2014367 RepID=UPI0025CFC611|nr:hypothetical protein [Pseudobutyrivibrio sp.]MBQ6462946.1 hypothetical protein [Pseudobutyrivibrio sp.]